MKFFKYAAKEFRIDPRQLKTEHVEAYFHHKITERLNRGVEPKVIAKRIDNELSHLKFFAWWISKPNCIDSEVLENHESGNVSSRKLPDV